MCLFPHIRLGYPSSKPLFERPMGLLRSPRGRLFQDFLVLGPPRRRGGSPDDGVVGTNVDVRQALCGFAVIQISRREQNKTPGLMQLVAARWVTEEDKDLVVASANNRAFLLIRLRSHQGACWHGWVFVVVLSTHPARVDPTDQLMDILKCRALGCLRSGAVVRLALRLDQTTTGQWHRNLWLNHSRQECW